MPFQAAQTELLPSRIRMIVTKLALPCFPSVTYNNQALYTQGAPAGLANQTGVPVVFISNNSVHEYISRANVAMNPSTSRE